MVIETPAETTLEQSVAILAPLRITAQNLESVGTLRDATDRLGWQFSFIRSYTAVYDVLKRPDTTRRQSAENGIAMKYQFFFRPAPKSVDAAKRRALPELIAEARRSLNTDGELRSVTIEPTPAAINAGRDQLLFGQPSGLFQYNLSVVAVFE